MVETHPGVRETDAPAVPSSPRRSPVAIAAAIAIIALSAIGFMTLGRNDDAPASQSSSVGDFLNPAGGSDGIVRIRYETPDGTTALANGGMIPIGDDLQLQVSISPFPPTDFDVDVEFRLTTSTGGPIDDASVRAEWDMPFMFHGPFETAFEPSGDGRYTAPFDFFMFGPWELMTFVSAPGHPPSEPLALSIYVWPE